MATRIRHKRSAVAGNQPSVAQLDSGELAINTADGKVYLLRDDNTVQDITKRIFENNTEVRVDDLADSASAEISMTVNGDEKMTVTNAGFNMKDDIDLEDFGKLTFRESIASGEDGIGIQAPFNLPNSYDLTLPLVNGTVGQILKTDGLGNLAFSDPDIFGGNVIYVSAEQGNDINDGQSAPVKTIKRACKLASAIVYNPDGTVTGIRVNIKVAVGDYTEDNPLIIPDNVVVKGDGLRGCIVRPANANLDMFRVRNACYFGEFTFRDGVDDNQVPLITWDYATVFDDPNATDVTDRSEYTNLPDTKPTIVTSPYTQNCSIISFLGGSGAKIDGALVESPNVPRYNIEAENPVIGATPEQGKSMVANAYTMLSFGGTGWRLLNDAYAQIVSCFQIFLLNGVYTQSGGYCSITNSATNFGLYALRSSGYSPKAFEFDRAHVVSTGASDGKQTLTIVGINRDAPVEEFVLRYREPGYRFAHDLLQNKILQIATDTDTWIQQQIATANAGSSSIYAGFTYNEEKCRRDTRLLVEAIRHDAALNSNARTLTAALTYFNGRFDASLFAAQKDQHIDSFAQAKTFTAGIVQDATFTNRTNALWEEVIEILDNGSSTSAPGDELVDTRVLPTAINTDSANAVAQLIANKLFLQKEITAWISSQVNSNTAPFFTGFNYNQAACENDVSKIVDALTYDLSTGGNLESLIAAQQYFVDGSSVYGTGQKLTTLAAWERLKTLVEQIIKEEAVSISTGNTETQDTSGTPATATEANFAKTRIGEIIQHIETDSGILQDPIALDLTALGVSQTLQDDFIRLDAIGAANIAQRVTRYINQEIDTYKWYGFTYDRAKCIRDTKLIVEAVAKDTWDTGNRYSRSAGLSYFRANIADSTRSVFAGEELQTIAAIQQAAIYANAEIAGEPSITTAIEDFVQSRFNIVSEAIRSPEEIPAPAEVSSEGDITNTFIPTPTTTNFNAATAVAVGTSVFTITDHGYSNGQKLVYDNNGNISVGGLDDEQTYYAVVLDEDTFTLTFDDSLEFPVLLFANSVNTGTHIFRSDIIEFFVEEILSSHQTYQTLILESGAESYEFTPGKAIQGTTGANNNSAFVASWEPAERRLIVSIEEVVVGSSVLRIQFDASSTITSDHASSPNTAISINEVQTKLGLGTSTFSITATDGSSSITNTGSLPEKQIWFHRPSIVNSSSHTWEFSGSGTDYNALPQNGGNTRGEFEQYEELPGRVYSSGTNELGDFKVGDFITAFNRTGNITFRNKVQVDELDALKLSLSDVAIEEISTDVNLGDDEIGGPSDARLTTQLAIRSFISNRLGGFVDKTVSTAAVPGAIVQLNVNGQLNGELIPATRQFTNTNTDGYNSRLLQVDDIPAKDLSAGDIATENYEQIELTLSGNITALDGAIITQPGVAGATGYAKGNFQTSGNILVATVDGAWDATDDSLGAPWDATNNLNLFVNGVDSGVHPTGTGASTEIIDNFFLKSSNTSQFLILDPAGTFNFTINTITSVARASNIQTHVTGTAHGLNVGNQVRVECTEDETFNVNGEVLSVPTSTSFTIANTGIDFSTTSRTGNVFSIVTSADGGAQGAVTEERFGVCANVDNANITGGSGYTPTNGNVIYRNVPFTNVTGTGSGAKANITVTAGLVSDVDISFGGTGYAFGDRLSADSSDIGGTGSGFEITIGAIENRAYVNIIGGELFVASQSSQDFVEDVDAVNTAFDIGLDNVRSINFLAGTLAGGGSVNYTDSRITVAGHGFVDGDPVTYDTLGNVPIGGLLNERVYYAKRITDDIFEIYEDYSLLNQMEFLTTPLNNNHNFSLHQINITDDSVLVRNHGLTTGDAVRFNTLTDGSTSNALPNIAGDAMPDGSRFFVGSITTNSFTLHTLRSDALSSINGLVTNRTIIGTKGAGAARVTPSNVQVTGVVNTSSRIKSNWNTLAATNIDAENIISGTISPSRLSLAGVPNSDSFLRGDSSYQTVVQSLKKAATTDNPITLTGSSSNAEFYGDPVNIGISNVDLDPLGTFSSLGVSKFLQTQFNVNSNASGEVFIKDGVVDAGTLDGLDSAYFLNPSNLTSAVPVNRGGTNITTYAVGDLIYAQSAASLNPLNIGRRNTFLKSNGVTPEWGTALDLAEGLDVGSAKLSSSSTATGQIYNDNVTTVEIGGDAENVKIGKNSDSRDISNFVNTYEATNTQDVVVNLSDIAVDTVSASANGEKVLIFSDTTQIQFGMTVQGSGSIPANTTVTGITDEEVFLSNELTGSVLTATTITFTNTPITLGIRIGDTVIIASSTISNLDGQWPVIGATESSTSFTIRTNQNVNADPAVTQVGTISKENTIVLKNQNVVIGGGEFGTTPLPGLIKGEGGIGTDVSGGSLTMRPGISTGNATGADFIVETGEIGTTGEGLQTITERLRIDGEGIATFTGYTKFTDTTSIKIPVGTSAQRPGAGGVYVTSAQGQIRYNTDDSTFEGFDGTNWGSLGGVKDVDQDTLIRPETSAGADNDELDFLTAGTQRMQIGATGNLLFGDSLNKFTVAYASGDTNIAGDVIVTGDLTVNGTTTTLNSTTLQIDDKNIELGTVASPTDSTANGGGITLKGATDHTITWSNANDSWDFSEHANLISAKEYRINNTSVLSANTLGANVINSSLQNTGALDGGSITSGFGNINIGSSNLTATGTISLGATSFNDNNITNVGSLALDTISGDNGSSMNFASSTVVNVDNVTQASNTTNGALIVDGGVGIAKNLHVGGTLNGNGSGLTTLNATNLSSGTVNDARLPTSQAGKTFTSDLTIHGFNAGRGGNSGATNLMFGHGENLTAAAGHNTGIGGTSMTGALSGDNNTALGFATLSAATSVNNNTAIGADSQEQRTSVGDNNTSVGASTMANSTAGSANTALGYQALEIVTGDNNIVLGATSGRTLTSGDNNILLGYGIETAANTTSNYMQIGNATNNNLSIPGVNTTINTTNLTYSGSGGFSGVGSNLTALNASQLTSGTVPDGRISSSSVVQHQADITGTGTLDSGAISSGFGAINIGADALTATGSVSLGATSFNDNNITNVGSIALDTIAADNGSSINFSSATQVNIDNVTQSTSSTTGALIVDGGFGVAKDAYFNGTINGNGSGLTSLNASNIGSGTVPNARIDGTYSNLTGTGALGAGSISSGFGNVNIGTSTFTGNGSGLTNVDAETLDGIDSTAFLRSNANDTYTGLITANRNSDEQFRLSTQSSTGNPYMSFYQAGTRRAYIQYVNGGALRLYNDRTDEYVDINSGVNGLTYTVGGTAYKIWHAGNDGAGSGLDADRLDNISSGSFLRSDANDSFSGTLTGAGTINITGNITATNINGNGSGLTGVTADNANTLDNLDSTDFLRNSATAQTQNMYIRNSSPTVYLRDTNHRSSMIHCNSNIWYILRGNGNDSTTWAQTDSRWPLEINLGNNNMTTGGSINARTEITAYGSDERLKENIKPIENALDKVKSLDGVTYDWMDKVEEVGFFPERRKDEAGVIAQQVQKVLPQAVAPAPFDRDYVVGEDGGKTTETYSVSGEEYLTVKYEKLAPLFIEAIKEQDAKLEAQAAEIAELKEMVKKLLDK